VVHTTTGEHGASKVLVKPAAPGTGVIAGGAVRQILEAAGVKEALAKSLGSPTHLNVAKAAMNALTNQRRPDEVARLRGKQAEDIVPPGLLAAYRGTESLRAHTK
jgi:small subunit ribosomal protein S5